MWKYKNHRNAIFGINNARVYEEKTIQMTFSSWRFLFNEDRENWSYVINNFGSWRSKYMLPVYFITGDRNKSSTMVYYVKFVSKDDYKQFIKETKKYTIKSIARLELEDDLIKNDDKVKKLREYMKINKERRTSSVSQ
mgnify:CR=1 FL=1